MAVTLNGTSSKAVWTGAIVSAYPCAFFAWVKPTSAAVSQFALASGSGASDVEFGMYADGAGSGSKLKAFARASGGGSTSANSTTALSTSWTPALVSFESQTSRKVWYGAGAVVTDTTSNSPLIATHTRFVLGIRAISDTLFFGGDLAGVAVWQGGSAMSQTDFDSLAAGNAPSSVNASNLIEYWRLENASDLTGVNGRVLTATSFSTASTDPFPSLLGGGVTLDNGAAGGTLSVSASDIGGGVTLDDVVAGGTGLGMQSGIVSALALRNWSGSLQTSVTIPVVTVCRLSDGAQVLTLTNQTTHASTGDLTITSASLLVGAWYMVMGWNADGSARFAVPLQATA